VSSSRGRTVSRRRGRIVHRGVEAVEDASRTRRGYASRHRSRGSGTGTPHLDRFQRYSRLILRRYGIYATPPTATAYSCTATPGAEGDEEPLSSAVAVCAPHRDATPNHGSGQCRHACQNAQLRCLDTHPRIPRPRTRAGSPTNKGGVAHEQGRAHPRTRAGSPTWKNT